ncbi:hypothetical protein [Paramagnetospirillum kuznetsovii]|uniref:hypothetical protein n=1 Tax=Paramagnetospirillum kuznetsovii TaxID=2053833 RepID=UPI00195F7528|nr:hypothetical protein [Paramagnetospirillum kuznetsovii]
MTRLILALLTILTASAVQAATDDCAAPAKTPLLAEGCAVLDRFIETFNARDPKAWAETLNFPHVRLAGGEVQVWATPEDYAKSNDVAQFAKTGWRYTKWDWRHLAQSGDDKLHFVLQFTRYGDNDRKIASFESLYILTKQGGHWGVQARSSYAGITAPGNAY